MKTCVVISCYNGEKTIIRQLESIANQTKKVDTVLIADDCSSDNTFSIVSDYIYDNNLQNWHITKNKTKYGWKKSFSLLIQSVQKEIDLIFLCDQDDEWFSNKVEKYLEVYQKNKSELIISNPIVIKESPEIMGYRVNKLLCDNNNILKQKIRFIQTLRPGCCYAVDRNFAVDCMEKYWSPSIAHDKLLWECAYADNSISYINDSYMNYYRYKESQTVHEEKTRYEIKLENCYETTFHLTQIIKREENKINPNKKTIKKIQKYIEYENDRINYFKTNNIFRWVLLGLKIYYYPNLLMYFGDLLYTLKRNK